MVMTTDETQIQIFASRLMSHAKHQNPEYRVVAAMRKLRRDKNCPAGKSWPNHVKNEQHIGSEKTYGPRNTEQLNIMMQRTANETAACWIFYRSCVGRQHFRLRSFVSLCSFFSASPYDPGRQRRKKRVLLIYRTCFNILYLF